MLFFSFRADPDLYKETFLMKFYLYGNMARAFFIMARALLLWPVHFYL